jgi:Uncharacterized protein conserved in bacteria
MTTQEYQGHVLAFLGDAVLSLHVRKHLLLLGYTKAKDLQEKSVCFVSAKAQAAFLEKLLKDSYLTEEELEIYKRGRNHNGHTIPKNTEMAVYRKASGLEALFGYWYLEENVARIRETFQLMVENTVLK